MTINEDHRPIPDRSLNRLHNTSMNSSNIKSLIFAVCALLFFIVPRIRAQQPSSMEQGTHAIILEETKKVLDSVSELKEQTKCFQTQFDDASGREAELRKTAQASDTPVDKRRETEARGLEAQANMVLMVNRQMKTSIGTYQQIGTGLDKIIEAADRGAMFSDAAKQAQAKLAATLEDTFNRDTEVYALVGRNLAKGEVPAQVTDAYRASRKRMLAAFEAMKRMNGSFDKKAFGEQMRMLRDQVQQRVVHYEMVRLLTEQQLQNIQTVAMANQLTIMGDEITSQIGQVLTEKDPLGLDALQPGREFDYLTNLNGEPSSGKAAQPSRAGALNADDFARPAKFTVQSQPNLK